MYVDKRGDPIPLRANRSVGSTGYYVHSPPVTSVDRHRTFSFYFGFGMVIVSVVLLVWVYVVTPWWIGVTTQWHYGDARVSVVDANVGHGGVSRFIAFDEQGDITIIEVVRKNYQVYIGAVVSGGNLVVSLEIVDVNHDGKPDLVIHIEGVSATPVLFNTGSAFRWSSY